MTEELYRKKVMQHFKTPRNQEEIEEYDFEGSSENHSCGDQVEIKILADNGVIQEVSQNSDGCMIAEAFASMASESIKGIELSEIELMDENDFFELLEAKPRTVRRECALTAFHALKNSLKL